MHDISLWQLFEIAGVGRAIDIVAAVSS